MPSLNELLKPLTPPKPGGSGEPEAAQAGLDPVGRELMNALLHNFKPSFEETPKEE